MRTRRNDRLAVFAVASLFMAAAFAAPSAFADSKTPSVSVTGEIVETSCYMRTGAKGSSHKKCAEICAKNGIPLALLDRETDTMIWLAAEDHMSSANDLVMKYIAKQVTIEGYYVERSGAKALVIGSVTPVKK